MLNGAFFLLAGLSLLFLGGEIAVRGIERLSTHIGLSKGFAGAVLIGFGTSMPELMTSLQALKAGSSAIAIGNIIGSNIANILLIGGFTLLMTKITTLARHIRIDVTACIGMFLFVGVLSLGGRILPLSGFLLLLSFVGYLFIQWKVEYAGKTGQTELHLFSPIVLYDILFILLGLLILITGASLTIEGAVTIARLLEVNEGLIGLSIIALGTSLPELAASVAAARNHQGEIILGNILGSCVFNTGLILGLLGLSGITAVPADMARIDVPVMIMAGLLLAFLWNRKRRFGRKEGGLLLLFYGFYVVLIAGRFF